MIYLKMLIILLVFIGISVTPSQKIYCLSFFFLAVANVNIFAVWWYPSQGMSKLSSFCKALLFGALWGSFRI